MCRWWSSWISVRPDRRWSSLLPQWRSVPSLRSPAKAATRDRSRSCDRLANSCDRRADFRGRRAAIRFPMAKRWMLAAGVLMALSARPAAAQDAPTTPALPGAGHARSLHQCGQQLQASATMPASPPAMASAGWPVATRRAQSASWTYVSNACPSAMINTPWPSDWSQIPAATDMTPIPVTVRMSAIDPTIAPLIGSHFRESVLTR